MVVIIGLVKKVLLLMNRVWLWMCLCSLGLLFLFSVVCIRWF